MNPRSLALILLLLAGATAGLAQPLMLRCATNKTVECASAWAFDPPEWIGACPPTGAATLMVVSTVTNAPCPLVVTRTWKVTDDCGNMATCSQSVTHTDTTAPVLSCQCLQDPALVQLFVTACSNAVPDLCALITACASDNCGPLTCTQSPPAGAIVLPGVHPITVTVTDCGLKSATCVVDFTVIEPQGGCTNPCPAGIRVWNTGQGGVTGNLALAPGTTDLNFALVAFPAGACSGPAQVIAPASIPGSWLPNSGESQWIGPALNVTACQVGVYRYQLRFNLPCVTEAKIAGRIAADNVVSSVLLNGTAVAVPPGGFGAWTPVSITSGFVTGPNVLDIFVNNFSIFTGFRAELTNTFLATNVAPCCCPPPQIACPLPFGVPCGTPIVFLPPPAMDLCCGANATVTAALSTTTNGTCPRFVSRVWQATDCRGQTTTCTQTVALVDTTPPVITCPAPITRVICSNSVRVYFKAKATDACSPPVTVHCVPLSSSVFSLGTTTVSCTATDACGNSSSCSFPVKVVNGALWQWLYAGVGDCYDQAGWEPTSQGACLNAAYPSGLWKNFDSNAVDRLFGHTWNFPASWDILDALLLMQARPPVDGCAEDDTIHLGLADCSPPTWLWSRLFGTSGGVANTHWCSGAPCMYFFGFSLDALPLASSGTINLLPHMNSAKRLDLLVQDDTTVDFAHLAVRRCAPQVLGGIEVTLTNAQLVVGPAAWCLLGVNPELPFHAEFSLGDTAGFRLPIEPVALADHQGASVEFGGGDPAGVVPRLVLAPNAEGMGEVLLNGLPPGVPVIELAVLVDGVVVQSFSGPASEGMLLASFDTAHPLVELALANRNELLATLLEPVQGQASARVTLRVRLPGYSRGFRSSWLRAALPDVNVQQPSLQMLPPFVSPNGPSFAPEQYFSGSDASLAAVSGGQGVVSRLDSTDSNAPLSFAASFPPTNEFRAVIAPLFGNSNAVPGNAALRCFVRGLIGGQEVDVDLGQFTATAGGTFDFVWDSTRIQSTRRLYRFIGPNGTTQLQFPGGSNVVVNVPTLPVLHGKLGGRTPCRRYDWPFPIRARIAGQEYEALEMLVLVETDNYPVTALTGLRVEAAGAASLALPMIEVGAEVLRVAPLERDRDNLWIRWTGYGTVLEEAHSVFGPWASAPGLAGFTHGEYRARVTNDPPQRFYRVKGL